MTVPEQELSGAADEAIFAICASERRTLVTLDRDFGQLPRFPPKLAEKRPVEGELWIVEAGRVRVHLEKGAE